MSLLWLRIEWRPIIQPLFPFDIFLGSFKDELLQDFVRNCSPCNLLQWSASHFEIISLICVSTLSFILLCDCGILAMSRWPHKIRFFICLKLIVMKMHLKGGGNEKGFQPLWNAEDQLHFIILNFIKHTFFYGARLWDYNSNHPDLHSKPSTLWNFWKDSFVFIAVFHVRIS